MTSTLSILRATSATPRTLHLLPEAPPPPTGFHGADLLADLALRAAFPLLANLSDTDRDRTGLLIGTAFGCLETDRLFDRSRREAAGRYASPAAFARTLPSTISAELALKLSLRGPSLTLLRGPASTALALRRAASWMRHLDLPFCIAGGIDWRTDDCQAAFLLLSNAPSPPGIGTLRISEQRSGTEDSLQQLTAWIAGAPHTHLGNGVDLLAAN
jgi:hypothetical protein